MAAAPLARSTSRRQEQQRCFAVDAGFRQRETGRRAYLIKARRMQRGRSSFGRGPPEHPVSVGVCFSRFRSLHLPVLTLVPAREAAKILSWG